MRPALQGIAADAKSAFLGGGGKGLLGREDLATWEIRGRLVATPGEPPRIDLEGGFRIDAADGTSFWALGADPGGAALVRRAESVPPIEGRGWDDLAARLGDDLLSALPMAENAAARLAAAWSGAGLELCGTRVELRARVVLQADGAALRERAEAVSGGEIRVRWHDGPGETTSTVPLDGAHAPPPLVQPAAFAFLEPGHYPVTLEPEAAAYCLHELGHAAIERGVDPRELTEAPGRALVEDPRGAPFPFGFTRDDLGQPAPVSLLWGPSGRHSLPAGHARRPTLSAAPRPSMSFTRLIGKSSPARLSPGPSLRARRVSAARYDPGLDRILLAVPRLELAADAGTARWVAGGVLAVKAGEAWQGLSYDAEQGPVHLVLARCTRLGCMHPVMVGAPTIALRSMQYLPGFQHQTREVA